MLPGAEKGEMVGRVEVEEEEPGGSVEVDEMDVLRLGSAKLWKTKLRRSAGDGEVAEAIATEGGLVVVVVVDCTDP